MKVVKKANVFKYYSGACIRARRTLTTCDNDSAYILRGNEIYSITGILFMEEIGSRYLKNKVNT